MVNIQKKNTFEPAWTPQVLANPNPNPNHYHAADATDSAFTNPVF